MNRYMIVIPAKNRSFVLKCDEGDGAKLETLQKLVSRKSFADTPVARPLGELALRSND